MSDIKKRILVVDDQMSVCYSLKRFLTTEGFEIQTAAGGAEALAAIEQFRPDVVIMDVSMPGMDGLEVLQQMKAADRDLQVIMMTAYSSTERAIEAMKQGAYEFLLKPFDNTELLELIRAALKAKQMLEDVVFFDEDQSDKASERIVGQSPKMLEIYKQIGKAAPSDASILILGETGTGKELLARAVYHHSKRATGPFMAINCAAIPELLLESELFGHEKGAYTGAEVKRLGKFEQCQNGTIFLDEIGDMSLATQAKLLRVLQDGSYQRLGGGETIRADVRIIAATNKDLETMVAQRSFRGDLYYRINVVSIRLPTLRERPGDIRELIQHFIQKYNRILGKTIKGIATETLKSLEDYPWPGNVRELENVVQKAVVLSTGDYLSIQCNQGMGIGTENSSCVNCEEAIHSFVAQVFRNGSPGMFQKVLQKVELEMVTKALELTGGNQVQAARFLGISRNTLRKKLDEGESL